jgi:hypothetical protein
MRNRGRLVRAVLAGSLAASLVLTGCGADEDLPGGTAGKDVLADNDLLVDGQIRMGTGEPDEVEVHRALCDYLFGTVDEVADTADLDGDVSYADGSGYRSEGESGGGFVCGYQAGDEAVFSLLVWDRDPGSPGDAEGVVVVPLPGERYGVSAYAPGYEGKRMPVDRRKEWLREAAGRIAER